MDVWFGPHRVSAGIFFFDDAWKLFLVASGLAGIKGLHATNAEPGVTQIT